MASTHYTSRPDSSALAQNPDSNWIGRNQSALPIRLKHASLQKRHPADCLLINLRRRASRLHPQLPFQRGLSREDFHRYASSSADKLLARQKQELVDLPVFLGFLFNVLNISSFRRLLALTLGVTALKDPCPSGIARVKSSKPTKSHLAKSITSLPTKYDARQLNTLRSILYRPSPCSVGRAKIVCYDHRDRKRYNSHYCGAEPADTGHPLKRKRSEHGDSANRKLAASNAAGTNSSADMRHGLGHPEHPGDAPKPDVRAKSGLTKISNRGLRCMQMAGMGECETCGNNINQRFPNLSHVIEHLFLDGVYCEICGEKFRNPKRYIEHDTSCPGRRTFQRNVNRWPNSQPPPRDMIIKIARSQPHPRVAALARTDLDRDGMKWINSYCWFAESFGFTSPDLPDPYVDAAPELAQDFLLPSIPSDPIGFRQGWHGLGIIPDLSQPMPHMTPNHQVDPNITGQYTPASLTGDNAVPRRAAEPYTPTIPQGRTFRYNSVSTMSMPTYSDTGSSANDLRISNPISAAMFPSLTHNTMSSTDHSFVSPLSSVPQFPPNMIGQPSNLTDGSGGINISTTDNHQGANTGPLYQSTQPSMLDGTALSELPLGPSTETDQIGMQWEGQYSGHMMQSMQTQSLESDVDHSRESHQPGPVNMMPVSSSVTNPHSSGSVPVTAETSRPTPWTADVVRTRHSQLRRAVRRMMETILTGENDILDLTGDMGFPGEVWSPYATMSPEQMIRALETYSNIVSQFKVHVESAWQALFSNSNVAQPT